MQQLEGRIFLEPSLEWSRFILENRYHAKPYYDLGYDYAIGLVADGRMRSLMQLYRRKMLTDNEFMNEIKPLGKMETFIQLSVHSLKAINNLVLKEVEYIEEI